MSTDAGIDLGLEQLFLLEPEGVDEDIHWACPESSEVDVHVLCGQRENINNTVPDWVEVNCKTCIEIDDKMNAGQWAKCRGCNQYFRRIN